MLLDVGSSGLAPAEKFPLLPGVQQDGALETLLAREPNARLWFEHPSSSIVHHESRCCEEARLWLLSYARSMEIRNGAMADLHAPTWLSKVFEWGPSKWPISWCQLVREKMIDCGAFAALAREIFAAQGVEAHGAQVLLSYNSTCTGHWQHFWDEHKRKHLEKQKRMNRSQAELEARRDFFPWIGNKVVYHEIVVIEQKDGTARFYDSTWGHWYQPESRNGFNSLLAVRSECSRLLRWDRHLLSCGEWVVL